MANLLILGATGSIGSTAINAVRNKIIDSRITGLVSYSSDLSELGKEFRCPTLKAEGCSREEIRSFIRNAKPDIALNGVAGTDGLIYTDILIDEGIDIALANKESIVLGGRSILNKAKEHDVRIIPVDSEHSAIYNLLKGRKAERLILTASGGPFYDRNDLSSVSVEEALQHPTWKMGKKITIDSATLANKGLEVIEASYLFSMDAEKIDVVIHRQSIVHSAIQTADGAVYALLSPPDMTLPIAMAIDPELSSKAVAPLSFRDLSLTFSAWDEKRFPMLSLAYRAIREGGNLPIAYCAADEACVNAFLNNRISFMDIPAIVQETMERCKGTEPSSIDEILDEARSFHQMAETLCLSR